MMLRFGWGIDRDGPSAAESGIGIAQLSILRRYRDRVGVDKGLVKVWAWFQLAGENQVMHGFAYRGGISTSMTSEQLDAARTLAAERASRIKGETARK